MIPGLIPLAVFIAADSLFGTKTGLIVSLALGVLEFAFIYFREKRADCFVLFDLGMIIVFAGLSLLMDNDIFFKIKPAVPELILSVILGISAFTPANLMQKMSARYLKGVSISEEASRKMKRSSAMLFFLILGHTALIIVAAFFMSTAVWGFISGVLFYILFGVYLAGMIAAGRLRTLHRNRT